MDGAISVPDTSQCDALESQITEVWAHVSAATYRFLALVAEFDRAEGWARYGLANCAQWLNWRCGISGIAAREKVRVARALGALPKISEAFGRGQLSYSKVRALTRVATPALEDELLRVGLRGTAVDVERLVRTFRSVARLDGAQQAHAQHGERCLSYRYEDDGTFVLYGRLPPEIGAVVEKALEAALEAHVVAMMEDAKAAPPVPAGTGAPAGTGDDASGRPAIGVRRADALRLMAERFLDSEVDKVPASADRYQVVVHVDQGALALAGSPGQRCEIENGPALAVATARRLACEAGVVRILENGEGDVLDVGRKTRAISPSLRRALQARDGGCRFPGCDHTRLTEGHHVRHWVDGGETKLSNLVTLCRFHHRLIHEGGFGVRVAEQGRFAFSDPDGGPIEESGCSRGNALGSQSALDCGFRGRAA